MSRITLPISPTSVMLDYENGKKREKIEGHEGVRVEGTCWETDCYIVHFDV